MTPEEYLLALGDELKSFPASERALLLEEIASHLESGEQDPHMGKDAELRRQKTLQEMGGPERLGSGLKKVHHPEGWLDFLLVLLPWLLEWVVLAAFRITDPAASLPYRIGFGLVCLALVLVGLRRRSNLLVLTWISSFTAWILTVLGPIGGLSFPKIVLDPASLQYVMTFSSPAALQVVWFKGLQFGEGIFWLLMFAGALYLLGWTIWRNRSDALIVAYALLVCTSLILGYLVPLLQAQSGWMDRLQGYAFRSFGAMMVWMDTPLVFTLLALVAYGILFIAYRRPLRWTALAGVVLFNGLQQGVHFYRPSLYALPEYFQLLLLPLGIVALGWWLERSKRRTVQPAS
jgi:hypothetical protein